MKAVLIVLFMVCAHFAIAQSTLIASNSENTKDVVFSEKMWVRIKTKDKKHTGRLKIVGQDFLQIRQDTILLSDILKIKRQPLAMTVAIDGFLGFVGTAGVLISFSASRYTGPANLLGLIPSGLVLGAASLSPNPIPALKKEDWVFTIE